MITHDNTSPVEQGGITAAESGFVIKASAKAFDIMSSNLYSDKIKAIVRELSCNAYDSHVAAGHPDLPFEIHLPTYADPTFYVKDYGTGLTREQIVGRTDEHGTFIPGLYQTFFESTKDKTNDMIGCLGLGSKTPFAYTRQFTVESRQNGKKMIFTAFKNKEGLPSIVELGEADTDEPNGLTISMGVNPGDLSKFEVAAKKALMYFSPLPNVIGESTFRPYELKHTVHGDGWRIRQSEYYAYMNGPYVVQGFVAYPVQTDQLDGTKMSEEAKALLSVDVDLYVPIGQAEPAPSREALTYDDDTIVNIVAALEHAGAEMRQRFQESFDECETYWDAAMLLDRMLTQSDTFTTVFKKLHTKAPFTWKGKVVDQEVTIDMTNIRSTTLRLAQLTDRGNKVANSAEWGPGAITTGYTFNIQGGLTFLVDHDTKGKSDIIRQYLGDLPKSAGRKNRVIILRPTTKSEYDQAEIESLLEMFGVREFKYVRDLPYRSTKSRYTSGQKRDRSTKLVWDGFKSKTNRWGREEENRNFSRLTWRPETIDADEGGLFIRIDRFTPMLRNSEFSNIDMFLSHARQLGLVDSDLELVGLNDKEIAQFQKQGDWYNIVDDVASEFDQLNEDGIMFKTLVLEAVYQRISNRISKSFAYTIIDRWSVVEPQLVDSKFKDAINAIVNLGNEAPKVDSSALRYIMNVTGVSYIHIEREAEELVNALFIEYDKYALFTVFDWGRIVGAARDHVISYINSVDTSDAVSDNDLRLAA